MTIKIKQFQLENIINTLSTIKTEQVKVATAFKVSKLLKLLSESLTEMNEKITEIQKEHAKKDENGEIIFSEKTVKDENGVEKVLKNQVEFENIEEMNKKINELMAVELEIQTPVVLTTKEFDEVDYRLPLQTMFILEPLFQE